MSDFHNFETGMGTTVGMWQMVSDLLDGEKLPEPLNQALTALAQGQAEVVPVDNDETH